MANKRTVPARIFPQSAHDSLAELRQIAKRARSRDDPALRWATEDEIALATSLRKDWHCSSHSSRTGLPCTKARVLGAMVCTRHGASAGHVKAAANQRLREMVSPVLARLRTLALQSQHLPTAYNAARDLADRAGIGELAEAKAKALGRDKADRGIVVNIGFLGTPEAPMTTIVVERPSPSLPDGAAPEEDGEL